MHWLLLLPALLVLVLFALSNQEPVTLRLWPLAGSVEAPLAIAILVLGAGAFLCGALVAWFASLPERSRGEEATRSARSLARELAETRARVPRTPGQPVPGLPRLERPAA